MSPDARDCERALLGRPLAGALVAVLVGCHSGSPTGSAPVEGGSDASVVDASSPDATATSSVDANGDALEDAAGIDGADDVELPVREDGGLHICPPADEEVAQVCCGVAAPGNPECTELDGGCYLLTPCDPCPSDGGTAPACGALGQPCADPSGTGVVMACGFRCVGRGGPCP